MAAPAPINIGPLTTGLVLQSKTEVDFNEYGLAQATLRFKTVRANFPLLVPRQGTPLSDLVVGDTLTAAAMSELYFLAVQTVRRTIGHDGIDLYEILCQGGFFSSPALDQTQVFVSSNGTKDHIDVPYYTRGAGLIGTIGDPKKRFEADPATNVLTNIDVILSNPIAHNLSVGDFLTFYHNTSGTGCTIPAGLSEDTLYYVIASGLTATEFKVSATPGGSEVDILGLGRCAMYFSTAHALADDATDTITTGSIHGQVADDLVSFTSSGTLPGGLVAGTAYYVLASGLTDNSFKVSLTPGGSTVDITDSGSGMLVVSGATHSYTLSAMIHVDYFNLDVHWQYVSRTRPTGPTYVPGPDEDYEVDELHPAPPLTHITATQAGIFAQEALEGNPLQFVLLDINAPIPVPPDWQDYIKYNAALTEFPIKPAGTCFDVTETGTVTIIPNPPPEVSDYQILGLPG